MLNQKQRSVAIHDFGLNPRADVPRSVFPVDHGVKQPFNFSDLVPILVEEVLPGDTWNVSISVAARTAVPLVPLQENWHLEFFTFFVPMRLVWTNARKFWGEQDNPGDSISYTIPQTNTVSGGVPVGSLWDYMGIPPVGQCNSNLLVNALPLRAYYEIWNEWFRDENLQNSVATYNGDGPDPINSYFLQQRGKRFDYVTQALPWPQKGNTAVSLPLGTSAPVISSGTPIEVRDNTLVTRNVTVASGATAVNLSSAAASTGNLRWGITPATSGLIADLTTATGATINQLRQAITLQQYLERDARGGTRYTEFVFNHFGVRSPDARLQRPEFIGGGHADINTTAIAQTTATGLTGGTTPLGNLAASGHVQGRSGFTYASTEHGYILTLVSARSDLTYQQGLRKMWSRSTRYDFPVPLLANLGEQALLNKEIYLTGTGTDDTVFGYVPRWDEFRHFPSRIAGLYRSTSAGTIDYWHSAQKFTALPTLNSTFITDDAKTITQRNFAAGAASAGQQILGDFAFRGGVTRALPAYGIPGLKRL